MFIITSWWRIPGRCDENSLSFQSVNRNLLWKVAVKIGKKKCSSNNLHHCICSCSFWTLMWHTSDPDGTLHCYQLFIKNPSIRYYGKLHENVQYMKCSLNMENDFKLYVSRIILQRIILWQISVSLSDSITSVHSEIAHYSQQNFSILIMDSQLISLITKMPVINLHCTQEHFQWYNQI